MKVLGKNVLVKGYIKKESDSGLLLNGNTEENIERSRYTYKLEVIDVGPGVSQDIAIGDNVVILRDALMKLSNDVSKWIEKKEGEYYLLVNEEDIKLVL